MRTFPFIPWWRRSPTFVLATLGSITGVDLLLWGCYPGWSAGAVCLGAGAMVAWRWPHVLRQPQSILAALVLGTAALSCVHDVGVLPILLALAALLVLVRVGRTGACDTAQVAVDALTLTSIALTRPFQDPGLANRWLRRHAPLPTPGWSLWLPAFGIGGVFLAIFALANPVLAQWLGIAWDRIWNVLATLPDPLRIGFWLVIAGLGWFLLRARLLPYRARFTSVALPDARQPTGVPMTVRVLLVANALFLLQTGMDAVYLWGGAGLPAGMTWAEYAHRGAYPLLAAALVAAVVVLVAFRPGGAAERQRLARILVWVWLAQTVVLMASSWWRLHLYVDAYGFTRWRCAAGLWMLLVAGGLGLIALRIALRRSNGWLLDANAGLTCLVLLGCAWIDWDGLVAWGNLERHRAGRGAAIDLDYLASLGPGALPALKTLAYGTDSRDEPLRLGARNAVDRLQGRFAVALLDCRAWTLVRARAVGFRP